jgi:hypothetical protein
LTDKNQGHTYELVKNLTQARKCLTFASLSAWIIASRPNPLQIEKLKAVSRDNTEISFQDRYVLMKMAACRRYLPEVWADLCSEM